MPTQLLGRPLPHNPRRTVHPLLRSSCCTPTYPSQSIIPGVHQINCQLVGQHCRCNEWCEHEERDQGRRSWRTRPILPVVRHTQGDQDRRILWQLRWKAVANESCNFFACAVPCARLVRLHSLSLMSSSLSSSSLPVVEADEADSSSSSPPSPPSPPALLLPPVAPASSAYRVTCTRPSAPTLTSASDASPAQAMAVTASPPCARSV
mmetsp:Transcript_7506/g.24002  ORF Transcript_7506/g.24002 Transcript_7506/m.24002 type:complete len:207 (-) Transcript_7506:1229-1849(-)